jgi:signal transduction histidine kinase
MQGLSENIYILALLGTAGIFVLILCFILLQAQSRNKLLLMSKREQEAAFAHQNELLHAIIEATEAEKKRIGMDLHDEIGTVLASLRFQIEKPTDGMQAREDAIDSYKKIIDQVICKVREVTHNLAPLLEGPYGLADRIMELSDSLHETGQLLLRVTCPPLYNFPTSRIVLIYRILLELVHNTLKHSGAKTATLQVNALPSLLAITYEDDGINHQTDLDIRKGTGLRNIESRLLYLGGTWKLNSPTGRGFSIQLQIPTEPL